MSPLSKFNIAKEYRNKGRNRVELYRVVLETL